MLVLKKPDAETLEAFCNSQAAHDFTFPHVGATSETPPAGFVVDHTRVRLGSGETVFRGAEAALSQWKHFQLSWVHTWPPKVPVRPGENVVIAARAAFLWWLNCCRIVYCINEHGPVCRSGFAYGTLPGHVECGEERFLIEWDQASNNVWYDILAFSRPRWAWMRPGYPWIRAHQKRFARDSAKAMQSAVGIKAAS